MKKIYIQPESSELCIRTCERLLYGSIESSQIESLTIEDDSDEWN